MWRRKRARLLREFETRYGARKERRQSDLLRFVVWCGGHVSGRKVTCMCEAIRQALWGRRRGLSGRPIHPSITWHLRLWVQVAARGMEGSLSYPSYPSVSPRRLTALPR